MEPQRQIEVQQPSVHILDLRRMAGLAEADLTELKTVLLAGKVSKDTLTDKKLFLASRAESGSMAVLGKSSIAPQELQQTPTQIEPQEVQESKKAKNSARKWLVVSACGLAVSVLSLGVHALRGGSNPPYPLPKKVLSQVFGFTPYYFKKDTPPGHLKLESTSPKFFSNALSFTMMDSKQEKITVSQKTLPTTGFKKLEGETAKTPLGDAIIKMGGGHITAEIVTSDKTYITLNASDFVSSGTLIDVFGNMTPAPKGAAAQQ